MHITASVFINDDESGLQSDYEQWLERLAPHEPVNSYRHNRTGEDNADAHLKRQVMAGKLWWQSPQVAWISAPGSRFSTESLTGDVESGCW